MKTKPSFGHARRERDCLQLAFTVFALWSGAVAFAELPAPDNILYGTITLDGRQMTAKDPAVVVEARRAGVSEPLATGIIGTGNYYTLRIPIEALSPLRNLRASLTGDPLSIVLRDATGVRGQTTYQVAEPGQTTRLDFGAAVPDADNDGLPDAWEQAMFGGVAFNGLSDTDGDGASNLSEYLAGTNPASSNDCFRVQVSLTPTGTAISFFARRAAGQGYQGRTRYYALESTTNLTLGTWVPVAQYTNILGADQAVVYTAPSPTVQSSFFRGRVRLDGE
jgi:hypothetical protein